MEHHFVQQGKSSMILAANSQSINIIIYMYIHVDKLFICFTHYNDKKYGFGFISLQCLYIYIYLYLISATKVLRVSPYTDRLTDSKNAI